MKRHLQTILFLVTSSVSALLVVPRPAQAQEQAFRDWTDIKGRTLRAAFVRASGDSVVLRGANNKEFTVSLQQLDAKDQAWIRARPAPWDSSLDGFRAELASDIWTVYQRNTIDKTTADEQVAWKKLVSRYEKRAIKWTVEYTSVETSNEFELRVSPSFVYKPGTAGEGTVLFRESSLHADSSQAGTPFFDHPIVIRAVPSVAGKQRWATKSPGAAQMTGTIEKIDLPVPLFGKDPEKAAVLVTLGNVSPGG